MLAERLTTVNCQESTDAAVLKEQDKAKSHRDLADDDYNDYMMEANFDEGESLTCW